jgi:DNA-binding NtrC family response regulator
MAALHLQDTERMPGLVTTTTRIPVIDDDACVSTAIRAILALRQSDTVLGSRTYAGIHAFQASQFDVVMIDLFAA